MKQRQVTDRITAVLKTVPQEPGVYKMLDDAGKIIYVGKAKDLRKRLQSYFRPNAKLQIRTQKMVEKVVDVDYTIVNSELAALILETNLIKELRPKYNVLMKDDKNYVYIRVSVNEDFPRITVVRKMFKDGARYFGPKTAGWQVKQTLKLLKKLFPYRHCQLNIDWRPDLSAKVEVTNKVIKYPCLDYHIKRCVGPCVGVVDPKEYKLIVDKVIKFLEGDYEQLKANLNAEMQNLASERKYEQAGLLRDKLAIIDAVQERQDINEPIFEDLDVINFVEETGQYFVNLFQVRDGKLVGQENFILKSEEGLAETAAKVLEEFLGQYYSVAASIPSKILIPVVLEQRELLEEWLKDLNFGKKVELAIPQQGRKNTLLELAHKNAQTFAAQMRIKWLSDEKQNPDVALSKIKELLSLPKIPKRIECYDISHLGGTETVGSMVVMENGLSKSEAYRYFRVKTVSGQGKDAKPDDFASLEEVLSRRLKYLVNLPINLKLRKLNKKQFTELKLGEKGVAEETAVLLSKAGVKEAQAVFWLEPAGPLAVKLQKLALVNKLDWRLLLIPFLQYALTKFKFNKIYLSAELEQDLPISLVELGAQESRNQPGQYVLERYKFALKDSSLAKKPDLIVIDGGKGQLTSALKAFKKLGISSLPIVSLAKKKEELFLPGKSDSLILADGSPEKHLLQRLRDEAHRFAITYTRNKRDQKMTQSQLDDIPGIGPKLKMKLLQKFGSLEAIAKADFDELTLITNKKIATKIKGGF